MWISCKLVFLIVFVSIHLFNFSEGQLHTKVSFGGELSQPSEHGQWGAISLNGHTLKTIFGWQQAIVLSGTDLINLGIAQELRMTRWNSLIKPLPPTIAPPFSTPIVQQNQSPVKPGGYHLQQQPQQPPQQITPTSSTPQKKYLTHMEKQVIEIRTFGLQTQVQPNVFMMHRFRTDGLDGLNFVLSHTEQVFLRYFLKYYPRMTALSTAKTIEIYSYNFPCYYCSTALSSTHLIKSAEPDETVNNILSFSYQIDIDSEHFKNYISLIAKRKWKVKPVGFEFLLDRAETDTIDVNTLKTYPEAVIHYMVQQNPDLCINCEYPSAQIHFGIRRLLFTFSMINDLSEEKARYFRSVEYWDSNLMFMIGKNSKQIILNAVGMANDLDCRFYKHIKSKGYGANNRLYYRSILPMIPPNIPSEFVQECLNRDMSLLECVICKDGFSGMLCELQLKAEEGEDKPPEYEEVGYEQDVPVYQEAKACGFDLNYMPNKDNHQHDIGFKNYYQFNSPPGDPQSSNSMDVTQ